jgi:hypothetical protein
MHDINHHHHHDHHHCHEHEAEHGEKTVSELEKLRKITSHWIAHNEDHANSYRQWAERARQAGQPEAGELLDRTAEDVAEQNKKLEKIIAILDATGKAE